MPLNSSAVITKHATKKNHHKLPETSLIFESLPLSRVVIFPVQLQHGLPQYWNQCHLRKSYFFSDLVGKTETNKEEQICLIQNILPIIAPCS